MMFDNDQQITAQGVLSLLAGMSYWCQETKYTPDTDMVVPIGGVGQAPTGGPSNEMSKAMQSAHARRYGAAQNI